MSALSLTMRDGREAACSMDTLSDFRGRMKGSVLVAGDPHYDEARQIWNGAHDKRPAVIARCSGVADVIEAVGFGRQTGALVAVRGGGHNVAGTSMCDGGLVIDLSPMKGVRVDPPARRRLLDDRQRGEPRPAPFRACPGPRERLQSVYPSRLVQS
jgi:hypothetical protein